MKWISVKDRLPGEPIDMDGDFYLGYFEDGNVWPVLWSHRYDNEKNMPLAFCFQGDCCSSTSIVQNMTHWMPLPQAPDSSDGHELECIRPELTDYYCSHVCPLKSKT